MTAWRAQDDDIQDDIYCAVEAPDAGEWLQYQLYVEQARQRREIVLEFEQWLESRDKRDA